MRPIHTSSMTPLMSLSDMARITSHSTCGYRMHGRQTKRSSVEGWVLTGPIREDLDSLLQT